MAAGAGCLTVPQRAMPCAPTGLAANVRTMEKPSNLPPSDPSQETYNDLHIIKP